MTRLIILDRDGVINFDSPDAVRSPEEWRPIPGALEAVADLQRRGWMIGVCSNQSGIGRERFTLAALDAIHAKMRRALAEHGGAFNAVAFCPHRPEEGCRCRKPAPGLLLDMMERLGSSPEETVMIGDSPRDIQAGQAAGCRCILVRTGNGRANEAAVRALGVEAVFDDLHAAAIALCKG